MHTSVLWTIGCGIGAFFALQRRTKFKIELMLLLLTLGLYGDWGICASAAILCMALTRNDFKKQIFTMSFCFGIGLVYTWIKQGFALALVQACFLFSIPALRRYNGKLSNEGVKPLPRFAFYLYYPAHLLVLATLREIVSRE